MPRCVRAPSSPCTSRCPLPLAPQTTHNLDAAPQPKFGTVYRLMLKDEDKLGEGQFATVRKAVDKRTGAIVAVKCIELSKLTKEDAEALKVEVAVMRKVGHGAGSFVRPLALLCLVMCCVIVVVMVLTATAAAPCVW